ncbi:MAG: cache domain-containing protein, partial [Deltaproteobacteria bacterium]|nr:cache domain-containing protein [Deltaproteobacteria bacterium]
MANQNPKYNSKLFYRVLSYLVPTVVIAFLSIWLVSSSTLETQIRERVTRGLKLSATGLATTLDATLNDMLSDAATTSRLYLPQEAIESGDPKNFQWYADELVSKKNRYLAIVVSDSSGKIIGTNTVNRQGQPGFADNLGQSISGEPWFQKISQLEQNEAFILTRERPAMLTPTLDEAEYVTGVIYPVLDILDEPIGLVSFFISHKYFGEILDQFTVTHRGVVESFALLKSADNGILARPATLSDQQPWKSIDTLEPQSSGQWLAPNELNFFMNDAELHTQAKWPWTIVTLKLDTIVNAPITAVSQKLIILF